MYAHQQEPNTTGWLAKAGNTLLAITMAFVFGIFALFLVLNVFLGCETWDKTQWNQYNSCVTPAQFLLLE
jgi:uncharacterized membrane protein (DUF2068 family)